MIAKSDNLATNLELSLVHVQYRMVCEFSKGAGLSCPYSSPVFPCALVLVEVTVVFAVIVAVIASVSVVVSASVAVEVAVPVKIKFSYSCSYSCSCSC